MHSQRNQEAKDVPASPAVDEAGGGDSSLMKFVRRFTRPVRRRPHHLLLDSFDHEFCIIFNFETDPETPESIGTCDIEIVPLPSDDILADAFRVVDNANKHGVLRFLAALGIQRFDDRVKSAFYEMTNPLR